MKTHTRFSVLASCLVLALACVSCTDVAITGRSQFNIVPDSTMNSMAATEYKQFLSENKKSTNAEQTAMVQRVGLKIANAVEKYCRENGMADRVKGYNWEFNLVENKEVNAWCMPGGKVVVYTGILPVTKDETGLAVVMGHEIAHAIARHGSERMSQGLMVQMGGIALSEAMASKPAATKELFEQSYAVGTNVGFVLPYSRLHENEADRLGLIFMAMAGYDPRQAVDFWQRMADQSSGSDKPAELLSTHPSDTTRINNIKGNLPEAMSYYKPNGQSAIQTTPVPAGTATSPTPGQVITTGSSLKPASSTPAPTQPKPAQQAKPKSSTQTQGSWRDIVNGPKKNDEK